MLCQGWKMGTFGTVKSGMSTNILFSRGPLPHKFEINNGNIIELTSEKMINIPMFPRGWAICPHLSKNSGKLLHHIKL